MGLWNFLRLRRGPSQVVSANLRIPLTPAEARAAAVTGGFKFVRTWHCRCGATLRLRRRTNLPDGPSNYRGVHTVESVRANRLPAALVGHSVTPTPDLNWNGLAEERGWRVDAQVGAECPACQVGLTVEQYKAARAKAGLL